MKYICSIGAMVSIFAGYIVNNFASRPGRSELRRRVVIPLCILGAAFTIATLEFLE